MNDSIPMLILITTIILSVSQACAQTARCDFTYKTYGTSNLNVAYYSCMLSTEQANFNAKLTTIVGQHEPEYSDNDVTFLANYANNMLKTYSSVFCNKFPNLGAILIGNAGIESIDDNALISCKFLFYLELFGNEIPSLPNYVFQPMTKLQELHFYNNKLKSISPESFANLPALYWLRLTKNDITEVPPKAFASLRNLNYLNLYKNGINKLYSDSFEGLENLETIMLHVNEISDLPVGVLVPLKNLRVLSMRNNWLTTLHSDSFGTNSKLEGIFFSSNPLNSIDERIFDKTIVSYLNMMYCVCYDKAIEGRDEIKAYARKCFDNYKPNIQPSIQPESTTPAATTTSCGRSMSGRGNVIGGTYANRGDYPWIVALVKSDESYFCGRTLVTIRKIITAAHCMQEKGIKNQLQPSMFVALLRFYNLNNSFEIGRTPYAVQSVNVHPEWSIHSESYDADIAVLVLETDVIYNKYIQPACVVFPGTKAEELEKGVVVGFGKSEDTTKVHESILKILEMPIHSNEDCFLKHLALVKISSKRTFCGGTGTGTGVCRGDSGGGLFVISGGAYALRGIVSSSLIGGPYGCDVDVYSVFTDVTKYFDWIDGVPTSRFE